MNVSVFETTIRILGGLLSAHLFAIDPSLNIYRSGNAALSHTNQEDINKRSVSDDMLPVYDGRLLALAVDLGDRLLPAFRTRTGIPYGTVNLRVSASCYIVVTSL